MASPKNRNAPSAAKQNNGTFSNIHAKSIITNPNYDDLSIASKELEACISEFFRENLKTEKAHDTGSIS